MSGPAPVYERDGITLYHGEALAVMPTLPAGSIDAVICDPPYPEIDREYGRWTEAEWHELMHGVVAECRRVLTPKGSAVFILQPNSERVGRMRLWLWEFIVWAGREWGLVQDAYWWNYTAPPIGGAPHRGLMRSSVKACVWLGPEDCHRDQGAVLWEESIHNKTMRNVARADRHSKGHHRVDRVNNRRMGESALERGGVTPFNLIPIAGGDRWNGGGIHGHTAATPGGLCDWWIQYICPPGGIVLDPFAGSGTGGISAMRLGRRFVGIERHSPYIPIAVRRLTGPAMPLLDQSLSNER